MNWGSMTHYNTCPKCGYKRVRCNAHATQTFEAVAPTLAPAGAATPWPSIQYEVYWGISRISDALLKSAAAWLAINAPMWGIWGSVGRDVPILFPSAVSLFSIPVFLRVFCKVPSWHNAVQTEPPAQPDEPQEGEDKREFAGWKLDVTDRTKTTMRLTMVEEWYNPPCPMNQAMSYALALVNNHFEWFDERHLEEHGANISSGNYRALRRDWLDRKWCKPYGKKTIVTDKRMILKIAFDKPE